MVADSDSRLLVLSLLSLSESLEEHRLRRGISESSGGCHRGWQEAHPLLLGCRGSNTILIKTSPFQLYFVFL